LRKIVNPQEFKFGVGSTSIALININNININNKLKLDNQAKVNVVEFHVSFDEK